MFMQRVHLIIKGLVQGVFFRGFVRDNARKLRLKGFVRNLLNGNVEVVAEGDKNDLEELIKSCKKGPEGASVEDVEIKYEKAKNEFDGFYIK